MKTEACKNLAISSSLQVKPRHNLTSHMPHAWQEQHCTSVSLHSYYEPLKHLTCLTFKISKTPLHMRRRNKHGHPRENEPLARPWWPPHRPLLRFFYRSPLHVSHPTRLRPHILPPERSERRVCTSHLPILIYCRLVPWRHWFHNLSPGMFLPARKCQKGSSCCLLFLHRFDVLVGVDTNTTFIIQHVAALHLCKSSSFFLSFL